MNKKTIITTLFGVLCIMLNACSIIRGYRTDGAYGPTSFSYEKQLKDTIVNHGEVFSFNRAPAQYD